MVHDLSCSDRSLTHAIPDPDHHPQRAPRTPPPAMPADMTASPLSRLQAHWVYGGALAGVLLLLLSPLLTAGLSRAGALVYFGLVAYMLHQYEEHDDDRFRRFVNDMLHREALTRGAVFVINIFGVWGVFAATLWATERLSPGWAAVSGWFLLVNGAAHAGQAIALRRSNPGLWTALALFLPLGGWTLYALPVSGTQTALAILIVVALHAMIVVTVRKARP